MKQLSRLLLGALVLAALLVFPINAQAQMTTFDITAVVNGCTIEITVNSSNTSRDYRVILEILDEDSDTLYRIEDEEAYLPKTYSVTLTQSYSGTITIEYEVVDFVSGDIEEEVNCTVQAPLPVTVGVPCGPALTGVGQGLLVRPTPLYWAPRQNAASTIILDTVPNAKTYWVLGMDSTRSFYKIVIACKTYWVPADTLVPNPDNVWRSAPLPTRIVD